ISRLASVREPAGDVHFCYDQLGRHVGMARTIILPGAPASTGSAMQAVSFSGLVLAETFDDGFTTTFHYDPAGRADSISTADGPLWAADDIDAAGRVVREHYGNGASQSYEYDQLGLQSRSK